MTTIRKWIGGWIVLMMAGSCLGSPGDALTVSEWSPVRSNLALRVSCPSRYEYDENTKDIYIKCEIKNTGTSDATVLQRARVFLVSESGQTNRCLHYMDNGWASPVVKPGETTTWWQHGQAPGEGTFATFVRWHNDEGMESATLPIALAASTIEAANLEQVRVQRLQEQAATFAVLSANTMTDKVAYTHIVLTNDPVIVNGGLYRAFSFAVPEQAGDLVWSFVVKQKGFSWYIAPEQGTMQGFRHFNSLKLSQDVPGIGMKGDEVYFQILRRSEFKEPGRYFIWFQSMYGDVSSVTVSLNFFDRTGFSTMTDFFSGLFESAWDAKRGGLDRYQL